MSRYKVGDKVRVREWEDMAKEFGVNKFGDIQCSYGFVREMRKLCGKTVTVSKVNNRSYKTKEDCEKWNWTDDMFESAEFCLDDIREEMIVMLRSGEFYVSIGVRFIRSEGYIPRCNYCKNMEHKTGNTLYDIVAVYKPSKLYRNGFDGMLTPNSEPIWKEKKRIEIPEPERTILENIDKKYEWIARDNDGRIYLYMKKPKKCCTGWIEKKYYNLKVSTNLFQFIQWEDEEPVNFREALKGE